MSSYLGGDSQQVAIGSGATIDLSPSADEAQHGLPQFTYRASSVIQALWGVTVPAGAGRPSRLRKISFLAPVSVARKKHTAMLAGGPRKGPRPLTA
ncbi:hypothetical protein Kisp01_11070 [Kineosporia sp. NBRC 101677]|nr:hypothetical protein Kisp01_11070 [Kineosporia sp. NBRC 101677]